MMCANYGHFAAEVRALDDAGADIFHCDIMDGSFVPKFTMGVMDVQTISDRATSQKGYEEPTGQVKLTPANQQSSQRSDCGEKEGR